MIAVDEEFRFGFTFARSDGRSVEFVENSAFALRLSVQSVTPTRLCELFESVARRMTDAEEGVV